MGPQSMSAGTETIRSSYVDAVVVDGQDHTVAQRQVVGAYGVDTPLRGEHQPVEVLVVARMRFGSNTPRCPDFADGVISVC